MDERPPFDRVKAAFYLVAMVISVQCFVVLVGVAGCVWLALGAGESRPCAARETLTELLLQAMAAALAFAGGYTHKGDK